MYTLNTLSNQHHFDFYKSSGFDFDAAEEILSGLRMAQKSISPKYFYDKRGSDLYEKITATTDYYLTRSETEILRNHALSIAALVGKGAVIIEPGAGHCQKIEYMLDALHPELYVPIDISGETLRVACENLSAKYPWLACNGMVGDFDQVDQVISLLPPDRPRLAFFPGSTLGNMEPTTAIKFLRKLRHVIGDDGYVLIGVDNVKNEHVLHRAYNDREGITAEFNKNILLRLNGIMDGDFDAENFMHLAFFNREQSRIEMYLVSKIDHVVNLGGNEIAFRRGETIHTENSYKYSSAAFLELVNNSGLVYQQSWSDEHNYFTVYLLAADNRDMIPTH